MVDEPSSKPTGGAEGDDGARAASGARPSGGWWRSRLALAALVSAILAAALIAAAWFAREEERRASVRVRPSFVPKTAKAETLFCDGSHIDGFRLPVTARFSWRLELPSDPISVRLTVCNFTSADLRLRVLAGPIDRKSAALVFEGPTIPAGASEEATIPLDRVEPRETRLFFEALGKGSGDVGWSVIRLVGTGVGESP